MEDFLGLGDGDCNLHLRLFLSLEGDQDRETVMGDQDQSAFFFFHEDLVSRSLARLCQSDDRELSGFRFLLPYLVSSSTDFPLSLEESKDELVPLELDKSDELDIMKTAALHC